MVRALKNYYHLVNAATANLIYNFPSKKLTVIGVTGTDGKQLPPRSCTLFERSGNKDRINYYYRSLHSG